MRTATRLFLAALIVACFQEHTTPTMAAIIPQGQRGCPSGAAVGGPNLVYNGDFSIDAGPGPGIDPAAGFMSDLPNRGPDVYPSDPVGGFSIQHSDVSYRDGSIVGHLFPGDPGRGVSAASAYWYSNPAENVNTGQSPFVGVLWSQTINGLSPNTTYNFFAYFDNLLPGPGAARPDIELRVDGISAGPSIVVMELPDQWIPIQYAFTTGSEQTSATLAIYDLTGDINGDDFGMAAINLRQCVSNIGLAKAIGSVSNLGGNRYRLPFILNVKNYGVDPLPVSNIQVRDDLNAAFPSVSSIKVENLASNHFTVNPNFNGTSDTALLSGNNSLGPQQSAQITFDIVLQPSAENGSQPTFHNLATITATVGSVAVEDASVPGFNPDPTGTGNPLNGGTPTSIQLFNQIAIPLLYQRS